MQLNMQSINFFLLFCHLIFYFIFIQDILFQTNEIEMDERGNNFIILLSKLKQNNNKEIKNRKKGKMKYRNKEMCGNRVE